MNVIIDKRTSKICGDCMWLVYDVSGSCWEFCKGRYKPMDKDIIKDIITGICPHCGEGMPVLRRIMHDTCCKECFRNHGALIKIRLITRDDAKLITIPILDDEYLLWSDYLEQQSKKMSEVQQTFDTEEV